MIGATVPDPEYVAARRVLLDALEALGEHRESIVLVGAQALYLHVGEGDLAVAPFTTDGDLAIDPRQLADEPRLVTMLEDAGFEIAIRPGTWTLHATLNPTGIQIDFLVPSSLAGPGRRGARLGPHGADLARKARGLEAALVDCTQVQVSSLEAGDSRAFDLRVAGTAAMLVAKFHKISERRDETHRIQPKDVLDVLRVLRFEALDLLGGRLRLLTRDSIAGEVTRASRSLLVELFANREGLGSMLAARSVAGLEDEVAIALSCEVLTRQLLEEWW